MRSYGGFVDCNQRQPKCNMLKIPNRTNCFFLLTLAMADLMCMSSVNLEPIESPQMFLRVEQY